MKPDHRECMLCFDEMAIQGQKDFDKNTMTTLGLCTLPAAKPKFNKSEKAQYGNDTQLIEHAKTEIHLRSLQSVAEKALVFVLGGIKQRWKQTVAYHFTGKSFNGEIAMQLIVAILKQIYDMGLMCRVIVSDMGCRHVWKAFQINVGPSSNVNWIPHPCDSSQKLWIIPDPVHVFKAIMEMLRSNGIIYLDNDTVKSLGYHPTWLN